MRFTIVLMGAGSAALLVAALGGCSTAGDDGRSGLSQSFSADNFRRSDNTNGTQTRPDVNRMYTAPVLPTIGNRGY